MSCTRESLLVLATMMATMAFTKVMAAVGGSHLDHGFKLLARDKVVLQPVLLSGTRGARREGHRVVVDARFDLLGLGIIRAPGTRAQETRV